MKTKRLDIHRPSEFIPSDYEYHMSYNDTSRFDGEYIRKFGFDCQEDKRQILKFDYENNKVLEFKKGKHSGDGLCCISEMRKNPKVKWANDGGEPLKCTVCSTYFVFGDIWKHTPTGEYIHIGHNCADKYNLLADRSEWELKFLKEKKKTAIEISKKLNEKNRKEFLKKHDGLDKVLSLDHPIVKDIHSFFKKKCYLTDKQIELVYKINSDVKTKKENPEPKPTIPAPIGRLEVQGKILGLKELNTDFGTTIKILVKLESEFDGAKVYITRPKTRKILGRCLDKGDTLKFKATFTQSKEDEFFSFGKRPKFIELISEKK